MIEEKFDNRQLEGYKKMTGEERLRIASELSEMVREIARIGIHGQHPEFSQEEIETELQRRISYGRTTPSCPYCKEV